MTSFEGLGELLQRLGVAWPADGEPDSQPADDGGPGCERWCHGRGYRRTGSTFIEGASGESRSISETLSGLSYGYCGCAAGGAARERHEAARAALDTRLTQQAAERIWTEAQIPPKLRRYSLGSYLEQPGAQPALVEKLRRWQAAAGARSTWLLFFGDVGTCKTGLSMGLLADHLAAGASGLYVSLGSFLRRIRLTYRASEDGGRGTDESEVLASAAGVGLLVIDDVGAATLTEWGQEKLFALIYERDVQSRPTIITTNLAPMSLERYLGRRSYDRIRDNAQDAVSGESFVIELRGPSRRGAP